MSSDEAFVLEVLTALREIGLEAVVVGSVAGLLQGAPVTTDDMDVLVRDTPKNREKIQEFAAHMGGRLVKLSPLTQVLRLTTTHAHVDFLFDQISGGLTFESVRSRARHIDLGPVSAVVASLEDIIASKEAAGRPKDLAQLPLLKDTVRVLNALNDSDSGKPER